MSLAQKIWNQEKTTVETIPHAPGVAPLRFTIERRYFAGVRGFRAKVPGRKTDSHRILTLDAVESWADGLREIAE